MENVGDLQRVSAAINPQNPGTNLVCGTGEMAEHIRAYPWSTSPLGVIEDWSPTLLAMVNVMLNSPTPTAVYWGAELIFLCNDASVRLLGAEPAQLLGVPAEALWGSRWAGVETSFQSVLNSGASCRGESFAFGFRRYKEPEELFANYALSPIYQDGRVVGVFRTLEETTDSVHAMRALAESDARLRMALSVGGPVGLWDLHIQKNIVYGDETIASFYGIDPEAAAAGTSSLLYERMLHPDDIVLLADAVMSSIMTGKDFSVEYRVRREDQTYRWIQSRGRCVYDENGHACRITGLKTDVTDQKTGDLRATLPRNLFPQNEIDSVPSSVTAFVAATANLLAEFPSEVEVEMVPENSGTQIILRVAKSDLGKLVGKQGRIIRSIRILLQTVAATCKHRFSIDVEPKVKSVDQPE